MAKGRAYGDGVEQEEQEAAWYTLHQVVRSLLLLLAPISPFITDHIWRKLYGAQSIHLERFPQPTRFDISEKVSESILEFNARVWKAKRDRGLTLRDSISTKVPANLKQFEKDLVRMHHITR
jgi:valyl-tRNA synthetase